MTNLRMKFLWIHSDHPETEVHLDVEENPDVEENRDLQGDLECPESLEIRDHLDLNRIFNHSWTSYKVLVVKKDHHRTHFLTCKLKLDQLVQEELQVNNLFL